MTEPVDVVRLREAGYLDHRIPCPTCGVPSWAPTLLDHLQKLTDAVERTDARVQALHDRLDTLERAWRARGSL